ncbi:MAG: tRNA (adenosine(37)-N6)-dimethylallyltransferase MiaA [Anaerohalosphaeraceae bacterium]
MDSGQKKILILGVTASGKGALAFELARTLGGGIISIDSMKVYRRMDIGTAKPPLEKRKQLPYYLVDVVEPWESFSVDQFLDMAYQAIDEIAKAQKPIIAVGGTAMYIKALLYGLFEGPGTDAALREQIRQEIEQKGLEALHRELVRVDPEAAGRIHPNDQKRIIRALEVYRLTGRPISSFQRQWTRREPEGWTVIGLRRPKELESRRINQRVKKMMDEGFLEEVRGLLNEPRPMSPQARAAIGYAEMIEHLEGKRPLEETVEQIKINTRRLAKAQRTWFKTFCGVRWIDIGPEDTLQTVLQRCLSILDSAQRLSNE